MCSSTVTPNPNQSNPPPSPSPSAPSSAPHPRLPCTSPCPRQVHESLASLGVPSRSTCPAIRGWHTRTGLGVCMKASRKDSKKSKLGLLTLVGLGCTSIWDCFPTKAYASSSVSDSEPKRACAGSPCAPGLDRLERVQSVLRQLARVADCRPSLLARPGER